MNKLKTEKKFIFHHPDISFGKLLPKQYVVGKVSIYGYQVSSFSKNIPESIENFYDRKLKNLNWERSFDLNADGPFGNAWGYKKKDEVIIFTLRVILIENKKSIFLSKTKGYKLSVFINNKNLLKI